MIGKIRYAALVCAIALLSGCYTAIVRFGGYQVDETYLCTKLAAESCTVPFRSDVKPSIRWTFGCLFPFMVVDTAFEAVLDTVIYPYDCYIGIPKCSKPSIPCKYGESVAK